MIVTRDSFTFPAKQTPLLHFFLFLFIFQLINHFHCLTVLARRHYHISLRSWWHSWLPKAATSFPLRFYVWLLPQLHLFLSTPRAVTQLHWIHCQNTQILQNTVRLAPHAGDVWQVKPCHRKPLGQWLLPWMNYEAIKCNKAKSHGKGDWLTVGSLLCESS